MNDDEDVNVLCQGQPVTTDGAYPGSEGSMPPLQTKQTPKTLLGKESRMATIAEDTTKGIKKKSPRDFLNTVVGRPVVVKLNNGVIYRGILACLDGFMNIAMEQTEEYVNGQLKKKYGDSFIRGNNVLYISPK